MKIRKLLIITSLSFGLLNPALSAELPKNSKFDNRMQYQNYNASDITVIKAKSGYATAVTFSPDERIIDIAVGFEGWEVKDNNNVLYIKPVAVGESENAFEPILKEWDTNLLITTNKRQYAFDLILVSESSDKNAYFIKFSYPNEEAKARALANEKKSEKIKDERINQKLDNFTIPKNWDYGMKIGQDSKNIAPSFAYDDGVRTYFGFDSTTSIPAVFYYQGEQEMMSNSNLKKQGKYSVLVVHKTANKFIFRSGNQVVGIINHGFGKNPANDTTTTNKNIERVLR